MAKKAVSILLILTFTACFFEPLALAKDQSDISCDWPMFGRTTTRDRTVAGDNSLDPKMLTKSWELKYKDNSSITLISENMIYQSNGIEVTCRNVIDGSVVWTLNVYSIERFLIPTGHTLVITDDKLFFYAYNYSNDEKRIICLNKFTGELINSYNPHIKDMYWHSLIYDSKLYYSDNEKLYCLDTNNWQILWTYPEKTHYRPIIHDGCLFKLGITCLDAITGEFVWKTAASYGWNIAYSDGQIFTESSKSSNSTVHCISSITGQVLWQFHVKELEKYFYPYDVEISSISNGKFFFFLQQQHMTDNPNELYCFDINSKKISWSIDFGEAKTCEFTHANGLLLTGTNTGKVLFIDENTGQVEYEIDLGEPIIHEIVVSCDKMFVSTEKGLYCYKLNQQ